MSQNLIQHVCVVGVALLLGDVRINLKPDEALPDDLPLSTLDELVSLGAVEKRIAEPNSSASEAAGSNEAGAAGGASPGTLPPRESGSGSAAEAAADLATEPAAAPKTGKNKAA